jgi:hypothetical protein
MESHTPDVKSLFCEALEQPVGPDRAAFLARAGADKPAVLAQVEKLLAAHGRACGFLDSTPGTATSLVGTAPAQGMIDVDAAFLEATPCPTDLALVEGAGTRLGP